MPTTGKTAVAEATENGLSAGEKRHLQALEKRIEQGLQTFREVGVALLEIRDSRLYRDGHDTFEDYCRDKWQLDRQRAYQFIGAAKVVQLLGDPEEMTNEAQARELATLVDEDPKQVKVIWEKVKATNEPVTAQVIRRVRDEVMEPDAPPEPSATDRLVTRIMGLVGAYKAWEASKPTRKERTAVNAALAKLEEVSGG